MTEKYPVELDDYECNLIIENAIVHDPLKSTIARMANKSGYHEVHMNLHEITDLIGWLAGEANHSKNPELADELNELCDRLETVKFQIKPGTR